MKRLFIVFGIVFTVSNLLAQNVMVGGRLQSLQAPLNSISKVNSGCTPLFNFDTPDPEEIGLATDGNFLWVGGTTSTPYYKVDESTGTIVNSIPKPNSLSGFYGGDIDFDGTYLWTIVEQAGTLYKIDPVSGNIVNQIPLPNSNYQNPGDPNNFGLACDDGVLWETEYLVPVVGSTLHKINKNTGLVIDSFPLNHAILPIKIINGDLWGIAFDVNYLFKIDRQTGAFTDSVSACVTMGYGLTQNFSGFWTCGMLNGTPEQVYLFGGLTTGISHQEDIPYLNIQPNPANEFIEVNFSNTKQSECSIKLIDAVGKTLDEKSTTSERLNFRVSHLANGVYFIRSVINGFPVTKKFQVSH